MSDLIGRSNPNYGEIAGKKYTRGTTSDTAGTIRNSFKKVVLESATGDISWRHQLSHLLKDANGDLIAGNSANLTDLNVPKEVELLMEEKAPSLNFAYGIEQPIEQTLNALLPKNSSVTKAVELLTVAADHSNRHHSCQQRREICLAFQFIFFQVLYKLMIIHVFRSFPSF